MAHFEAVVGDVGPARRSERRHAFLTAGPEMIDVPRSGCGVRFVRCPGYSDYYSNLPGRQRRRPRRSSRCRGTAKRSAPGCDRLQPGLAQSLGLAVMTNEARSLSNYNRSVRALRRRRPGSRSAPSRPRPDGRRC